MHTAPLSTYSRFLLSNCHYTDKITFILGWQDEVDNILKEQGKFVKTEDAPDSLSLYEETTSCTNNPLKPFDSQPQVDGNFHLSSFSVN